MLVVFVLFLLSLRFGQISPLAFFGWFTATWPAWVGFETAIFWQCSPGTAETQRLYPLRHRPRGAINMRKSPQKIKINSQNKEPHLKVIPIKDKYKKFGTDPTLEEQIRIYKTKKSILDRPLGPAAQRIEALSGSRWALSEDSGFKSYPSRPEVYLVKNVER